MVPGMLAARSGTGHLPRSPGVLVALLLLAGDAGAHGTLDEATAMFDREISARPADPTPHIRRAAVMLENGCWQTALADIELAVRKGAGRAELDLLSARALAAARKPGMAMALLDDFVSAHPAHAAALLTRARLARELGQPEKAIADFRAALSCWKNPEPDLYIELAALLHEQRRSDEAVAALSQGMEQPRPPASLAIKAMEIQMAEGRIDDALKVIDTMQSLSPRLEPWMARRASILEQAGRHDEAREAWLLLKTHLEKLPEHERGSHAMSMIALQAAQALRSPARRDISATNPINRP